MPIPRSRTATGSGPPSQPGPPGPPRIADLVAAPRPTTSFELYPPRTAAGAEGVHRALDALVAAGPDFVSVTYGASGGTQETSCDLLRRVRRTSSVPALAHLTCIGASRAALVARIEQFLDCGVRSFLALRGDPVPGADWHQEPDGLARASDLVELLQVVQRRRAVRDERHGHGPLSIAVAAFPRPAGADGAAIGSDLRALRAKQDAGAHFAVTQVFYDAADYTSLVERARGAGVTIPLLPGIVPCTDPARLQRLAALTGVPVPPALLARLEATRTPAEQRREGLRASVELGRRVLDAGAPGLHLYPFNQPEAALELIEGLGLGGAHHPDLEQPVAQHVETQHVEDPATAAASCPAPSPVAR